MKSRTVFLLFIFIVILTGIAILQKETKKPAYQTTDDPVMQEEKRSQPLKIRGSIPYWDQESAAASFRQNVAAFSEVALFWYYITREGEIMKYRYAKEDKSIIDFAKQNNVKVTAVITNLPETENSSWDSDRVAFVIEDNTRRKKHIDDIASLLEEMNFDGISIDYEQVDANQRENFSRFIKELADTIHSQNKTVGVALHPKTSSASDKQYQYQDWQSLAASADALYVMSYGEHEDEGQAGPIASMPWMKNIIAYSHRERIAKSKIYLGIPLYGYDWNKDGDKPAVGLTQNDVTVLRQRFNVDEQWNESTKSPFFYYERGGDTHEVWYENEKSILEKVRLADEQGFLGVTFWRLGGEDQTIWPAIKQTTNQ